MKRRFDELAKSAGRRVSRREALRAGGATLGAGFLALLTPSAAAAHHKPAHGGDGDKGCPKHRRCADEETAGTTCCPPTDRCCPVGTNAGDQFTFQNVCCPEGWCKVTKLGEVVTITCEAPAA